MKSNKRKQIIISVVGIILLIAATVGITYAFFNYTRTGAPNSIRVGDIYFNSDYDNVSIGGVFPVAKTSVATDTNNVMTVNVDVEGHTTYVNGIYYEVKAEDVNLTVNGKNIPIGIQVTSSNLSNVELTNYEDGKVLTNGSLFAKGRILASSGSTDNSIDGTITIKAYIDKEKIAISDTYNGLETDLMGTTNGWVNGRVVLTTTEWNSLSTTPLSFKVKVEAEENDVSTLVNGTTFIGKIKKLSNPNLDDSYDEWEWWEEDENITTFQRVTTAPDTSSFTDANIISTNDSVYPIYAWYENGVIKYYTESDNIKANTDMSYMFAYLTALTNIGDLSSLDTTNVVNMEYVFQETAFVNLNSLSSWNVSNVENMNEAFGYCDSLSNINGIANWNVSNVVNMEGTFADCTVLTDLTPLSNWNVSNVTDMSFMFFETSITTLEQLSNWNTSNVENMLSMFNQCQSLSSLAGIANWNTSNVTNLQATFHNTKLITNLDALRNWNVSNVEDMQWTFSGLSALEDASAINNWNISSVTNFNQMFQSTPTHPEFTKRAGTWNNQGTFTPSA